ncbi:sensor histidine kinase [Pseudoduganella plicata]|uniref:histidine kinase n=1 Tax=Pseudoduganella plicata TaxID=321984 RepID=A0A4P7BIN1_9BURK|nr:HAMP domain-containing sensor histidine kinase [Pseudoduganella plicata]QBQ37505.1 HAMP domain-containing histidine kinase [Pseudoduganella plicata]GGY90764.1 two-component sensor histidine kinase [Pseudoduganella plicata]
MPLATDQNINGRGLSSKALQFSSLRDTVMDRWEREVRARVEGARELLGPVLTNTLPAFYDNIAEALSPAHPRKDGASDNNASTAHGSERARLTQFGPDQVVHEYHLFREAISDVAEGRVELDAADWRIIDRSINRATREAVRAFAAIQDELRSKMAAALSHDMRTPLSVIANSAQLISVAPTLEMARKAAQKIESNTQRLDDMMGELLDALTMHTGATVPLSLSRFNAFDLVNEMREQYCESRKGGQEIQFEAVGETVIGHWCRGSMRRALENLINNAIKYGDNMVVRIMAREARGRLMLSVHNEGNPIPEDRHNRIFDYLTREGEAASRPGWGIGLQFVKAVAESHGGSVTVDSSPEMGTTFLIDVPVDCRPYARDAKARS